MYKNIFSNTFASREDCEMFLMVLKQQWPQMKDNLPGARLEIIHDPETPHMMQAVWMLKGPRLGRQCDRPVQGCDPSLSPPTGTEIGDAGRRDELVAGFLDAAGGRRGNRRHMTCPAMLFWPSA